jgi:hypothetical protein
LAALFVALAGVAVRVGSASAQPAMEPPIETYPQAPLTPPPSYDPAQSVIDPTLAPGVTMPPLAPSPDYLTEVAPVTPVSHMSGAGVGCANCDRWYFGLSGGWQERETVHEVGAPTTFITFDSGFAVNAQLGYRFDMFRVEAEYSFMNNDCLTAGAAGFSSRTDGNVNLRAFMLNVYHDFSLFDWRWEPYVGAGIGVYQSELNGLYPDFFDGIGFDGQPINATSDMPLAYQFRGGMQRDVGQRSTFFVGYRYFKGEELEFASAPFATPAAHTFHPDGAAIHSLEWGLRVRF